MGRQGRGGSEFAPVCMSRPSKQASIMGVGRDAAIGLIVAAEARRSSSSFLSSPPATPSTHSFFLLVAVGTSSQPSTATSVVDFALRSAACWVSTPVSWLSNTTPLRGSPRPTACRFPFLVVNGSATTEAEEERLWAISGGWSLARRLLTRISFSFSQDFHWLHERPQNRTSLHLASFFVRQRPRLRGPLLRLSLTASWNATTAATATTTAGRTISRSHDDEVPQ